jgi:hypothetical protein
MTASKWDSRVSVQPVLDRLEQLARLGPNWDSYGGAPPTAQAVHAAHRLVLAVAEELTAVAGESARPYAVAPLADGCVQLTWRGPRDEVEVEIGPRDNLAYLLVKGQGSVETVEEAEDVSLSEVIDLVARVLLSAGDG